MAATLIPSHAIRVPLFHVARGSSCHAVVLALIALMAGCSLPMSQTRVTLDPPLDNLAVQSPLPIRAGVYYSPEFSTFQYQRNFLNSVITVDLGNASLRLFDRVLRDSFKEVVRLDSIPVGLSSKPAQVDVIVEPRIEAFHIRWGMEGDSEYQSVTYRLRLHDPHGVPIGGRLVRGKAVGYRPKPFETYDVQSSADLRIAAEKVPAALNDVWTAYQAKQTPKTEAKPIDPATFEVQIRRAENPYLLTPELRLPLVENGIVAISVSVKNNGVNAVLLRDQDFTLLLPTGRAIASASTFEIPQRFALQAYSVEADAWRAVGFGAAGIATDMQESAMQVKRRAALTGILSKKGFNRPLRAGETAQGTVFFVPAYDVPAFSSADLLVWLVHPDSRRTASTKVPVANLAYQPTKAVMARRQSEAAAAVTAGAARAVSAADTLTGDALAQHFRTAGRVDVKEPNALLSLTFQPGDRLVLQYFHRNNPGGVRQEGTYSVRPEAGQVCFRLIEVPIAGGGIGLGSEWMSDCFRVSQTGEKTYSLKNLKGDQGFSYSVR